MSLFEFVDELSTTVSLGKIDSSPVGPIFNPEEYLRKGEKILTLLREKKHKVFVPSGLFEAVNMKIYQSKNYNYDKLEYLGACAEKILKHKWIQACDNEDFGSFFTLIERDDITVRMLDKSEEAYVLLADILRNKHFDGGVLITERGKDKLAPMGKVSLTKRQQSCKWRLRYSSKYYALCDVVKQYGEEYLYHELRKRVLNEIEGLTDEQMSDNVIVNFLYEKIEQLFNSCKNESGVIKFHKEVLEMPYVREFVEKHDLPVCASNSGRLVTTYNIVPLWFISRAPFDVELTYCSREFILQLFEKLYDAYIGDRSSNEFIKSLASEYAKVYQTKKAIPDKVIKAMENSGFNEFFGYVEFDEECDLNSIAEIEKEFRALQEVIFHQKERLEDVSLRFRKLGHHRASGLYFPMLKCLCVDVRNPHSMAHEYGHMLDYENGCVSKGVKFSNVRRIYSELIDDFHYKLPKEDALRKRLEGNTKYNKAYYLEPTEIYARCLEMYLFRYMEIDNSLVKPTVDFAYPEDESLIAAIAAYFDEFFGVEPAKKVAKAGN